MLFLGYIIPKYYDLSMRANRKPILHKIPINPPKNADNPFVTQPQSWIGGVPSIGKHHENHKKSRNTITPIIKNIDEIIRVFPPEK